MKSKNLKIVDRGENAHMTELDKETFEEIMSVFDENEYGQYTVYLNNNYIGEVEEGHVVNYETGKVTTFKQLIKMIEWEG